MRSPEINPGIIEVGPGQVVILRGKMPERLDRSTDTGEKLFALVTSRADSAFLAATSEEANDQNQYLRPNVLGRDKELDDLNRTLHIQGHMGDEIVFAIKGILRTSIHRPDDMVIENTARFMADSLGFTPEELPEQKIA